MPVRQLVLSFPYELSGLAATRPDVLASLCRIFGEALALHYRTWAKSAGYTGAQTGAVTFVHRFGSSLNAHTHFHVVVLDGVYVKRGEGVAFFASPAPTREALQVLVTRVVHRAMKWLKRKHYVREDSGSNEEAVVTPLEALTRQRRLLRVVRCTRVGEERNETRRTRSSSGRWESQRRIASATKKAISSMKCFELTASRPLASTLS